MFWFVPTYRRRINRYKKVVIRKEHMRASPAIIKGPSVDHPTKGTPYMSRDNIPAIVLM